MVTSQAGKTLTTQGTIMINKPESGDKTQISLYPVKLTIPLPKASASDIYQALKKGKGFLLESMEGVPRRAVRSIIGLNTAGIFSITDKIKCTGEIAEFFQSIQEKKDADDPIHLIRMMAKAFRSETPDSKEFTGGFAGYCSYDMISPLTGDMVKTLPSDAPYSKFICSTHCIILDYIKETCTIVIHVILSGDKNQDVIFSAGEEVKNLAKKIQEIPKSDNDLKSWKKPGSNILKYNPDERKKYCEMVRKALDHIRAGDIFQVVISRECEYPYSGDPYQIYKVLRQMNPSPYLYYLEFPDEIIIGSSPEMLVKVHDRDVTTVPIAGTRPRGKDEAEDKRLAMDLLGDKKERAEHLMLVDLARNDIGKISAFGTVKLEEFMAIEKFSHVQHITSTVNGILKEGYDPFDALASCFPAGTVSGAPKIRAMQIISELENRSRGLYAGAVGYIGFCGMLEFAIAIRTIVLKDGIARFAAGAGIVADSDPDREFEETISKASAMSASIEMAGDF